MGSKKDSKAIFKVQATYLGNKMFANNYFYFSYLLFARLW